MLTTALILFAVAAVFGATMAYIRIVKKEMFPLPLAIIHGLFAASGLVVLILAVLGGASGGIKTSLVIFLVAAAGGFTLLSFHLRKKMLPIPLVLVHGSAAVLAFLILLFTVFL